MGGAEGLKVIGTSISYGIAWYRVWRAHFTGLSDASQLRRQFERVLQLRKELDLL